MKSGLIQLEIWSGEDSCLVVDRTIGGEERCGEHGEGLRLKGNKSLRSVMNRWQEKYNYIPRVRVVDSHDPDIAEENPDPGIRLQDDRKAHISVDRRDLRCIKMSQTRGTDADPMYCQSKLKLNKPRPSLLSAPPNMLVKTF